MKARVAARWRALQLRVKSNFFDDFLRKEDHVFYSCLSSRMRPANIRSSSRFAKSPCAFNFNSNAGAIGEPALRLFMMQKQFHQQGKSPRSLFSLEKHFQKVKLNNFEIFNHFCFTHTCAYGELFHLIRPFGPCIHTTRDASVDKCITSGKAPVMVNSRSHHRK